jgi:hypothetical protein
MDTVLTDAHSIRERNHLGVQTPEEGLLRAGERPRLLVDVHPGYRASVRREIVLGGACAGISYTGNEQETPDQPVNEGGSTEWDHGENNVEDYMLAFTRGLVAIAI